MSPEPDDDKNGDRENIKTRSSRGKRSNCRVDKIRRKTQEVKILAKLIRSPLEKRLKAWHGEDWHTQKGRIIRDIVYAIDTGLVTTVSFVAAISFSLVVREKILILSSWRISRDYPLFYL